MCSKSAKGRKLACAILGITLMSSVYASAEEITIWAWDPNFNGAAMKEAAERYSAANPGVTFDIVDFAKPDVEQKLQTQLAAGITDGLPDIVLIEDYGAQKYLLSFPGAFEPLNDVINYEDFANYKVALSTVGDKTYSLPFDTGVVGWFYRTDIMEKAGYSADDLKDITWSRYFEIAEDVKAKTGATIMPLDLNDPGPVRIMLQSAGSWYFDKDGNLDLANNPIFKASLETYAKFLQNKDIYTTVSGWPELTGAFTGGDSAGIITGVWMTGTIKAANMGGQWGVAPLPKLEGVEGATNASNLGGSSWYVLAASKEKEIAKDFLSKIWGSDTDFYQKILTNQGAFGTYLKARDGEAYSASDVYFDNQPIWNAFSDWLKDVPAVNYGLFTNEVDAAVAAQLPALANGEPVDEVIKKIDAQARSQTQ